MNNLVVVSDFKGRFFLPQSGSTVIALSYTNQITEFQSEFLRELLGYSFYKELDEAVTNSELEENPTSLDDKWTKLINGDDVVINEVTKRYCGLKELLIQFCYVSIMESNFKSISGSGISTSVSENGETVDPTFFILSNFNKLVRQIWVEDYPIYDYLFLNSSIYPIYEKSKLLKIKNFI